MEWYFEAYPAVARIKGFGHSRGGKEEQVICGEGECGHLIGRVGTEVSVGINPGVSSAFSRS